MATVKTSNTQTMVQNLGNKLVTLLNDGNQVGNALDTLGGYMTNGGATPSVGQTAPYTITDTQVTQTIASTSGNGQSLTYTLTGTQLTDEAQAQASKLVVSSSARGVSYDSGITTTSTAKSTATVTLTANPYERDLVEVTHLSSTIQHSSSLRGGGDSMNISSTTNLLFVGLEQYVPGVGGHSELLSTTIHTFSNVLKGPTTGSYDGVKFGGSTEESLVLASQQGLSYNTNTGALTGALDSLSYVSYTSIKAEGYSDGYNNRYTAGAFTAEMLEGLASAAFSNSTEARKAALFGGDDIITGIAKLNNVLEGGAGNDSVTGGSAADTLRGDAGNDKLFGLGGIDVLIGGDGDDVLDGGTGVDYMVGGNGNDTYILDNAAELTYVNNYQLSVADAGNDTMRIAFKGGSTAVPQVVSLNGYLGGIENVVITSTGVFNLTGNDSDNLLDAGKTASTLRGGLGDDTYYVGAKGVTVIEDAASGVDKVISSITYALGANLENLTLTGKAAINGTGNELANTLIGNDGANILDGGAGADNLTGGKGNDTYIVDHLDDVVTEALNEGTDTVKSSVSFTLGANFENLTLTGAAQDNLSGTGNALKNTITGDAGANYLDGGGEVDTLIGGKGDDTYFVDLIAKSTGTKATLALQDSITERKGEGEHDTLILRISQETQDKLVSAAKVTTLTLATYLENLDASNTGTLKLNVSGNAANNIITGNDGGNVLNGGAGNDLVIGGSGNDVIIGGLGADTLTGGGGADTFRFASLKELALGDTSDVITDFNSGEGDTLELKFLKGWTFNGVGAEHQATAAKQLWAQAYDENGETGLILHGNSGGSLASDFSIKLVGISTLTEGDLVLV